MALQQLMPKPMPPQSVVEKSLLMPSIKRWLI
jgi:hypothetical protein